MTMVISDNSTLVPTTRAFYLLIAFNSLAAIAKRKKNNRQNHNNIRIIDWNDQNG